jgi:hypothetical protein
LLKKRSPIVSHPFFSSTEIKLFSKVWKKIKKESKFAPISSKNHFKKNHEMHFVELQKILKYTMNLILNIIENQKEEDTYEFWQKLVTNQAFFDSIAAKIEEDGIDVAAVQAIQL